MQTQRALRTVVSKWVLVTLVSGLAGSAMLAELARQRNRMEARDAFGLLVTQVTDRLGKRIQLYEYGLRGLRGAVLMTGGAQGLDREGFHRYSASRDVDREFAGARGFGFIRRVPAGQVDAFLADARADGAPDFHIIELAPNAGERFVIQYIEPVARNLPALGLDVASEANRRQAAIQSMRSGQAAMTGPITLLQKTGERLRSVLFLLPVYQAGMPVDTAERREAACIGWSYAALSLEEVLGGPQSGGETFGMVLADVTDDGHADLLFQTPAPRVRVVKGLSQTTMLALYGRKWRVELHEREGFAAGLPHIDPWWVLGGGAVLTLLLAALVALLGQGRERRRIAAAHQGQLATIVENSADAIIGEAMDGTVISWNRAAERLFGYTEAEVLGQPLAPLMLPSNRFHEDLSLLRRIGQGEDIPPFDTTRRHRDGTEIDVSVTAGAMRGEHRQLIGVAKLVRDIRERKEAERRLRELAASLERQVQDRTTALRQATQAAEAASEAKGMFLANMSHEIRTPMNAVIGAAHLLDATELDDEQRRLLALVQTAGRSLLGIINDVLDLAKIEAGELQIDAQPFSPGEVMDDVEQLFAGTAADKGIALRVTGRQALPPRLAGDAMRLRQVLVNLVGNAVKFTQAGHVEMSVAVDGDGDAPLIWLDWTVRDTGIGMSPQAIDKLFAPFTQADISTTRRFGGTGLGLSIVHQLVTLMGGRIAVESEPGQGSVFRLRLPFEAADAEDVRYVTQPQPLAAGWLRGLRILLVDDSAINLEIGRGLLELEGAVVSTALNGQEALDCLRGQRGFDAVLMDLQMPVMDGYEATRRIKGELGLKDLPVLALTAGALSDEQHKAEAAGLDAFLTKPLDPAAMVRTLRKVVERARGPS